MGVLEGRRALVTGGASGIGRAIAESYVDAGARVVIADRDLTAAEDAARAMAADGAVAVDVADEESVENAYAAAVGAIGAVDVLVNSAGILEESLLSEMSLDMWRRTLDVDLTGIFLMCRAAVPAMIAARSGRIVNIASQLGIKGGVGLTHYAAAKAGAIALTKSLALEVSRHNVLVNAIAPGPIETPLVDGITDEWKQAKRRELPLGRFGLPSEVAPTAVLLASDPGGNLYVGQTLGPNSGDVMP
ncbi:SDR family NAD(P)-dependent oxidoreductase [Prescottella equi]|uniref:3-oxoacyl-ACP reductase n=1 Tax=Rhodococcus hoagii TaxID=43767 RepID=A0A9Q4ZUL5_RHOHA|nr:SDR family NAD(P)-dependent oxidoreductase [Prescottella equi]MBU4614926.1 SDR family oxidoreductase [Rhodococcus sp. GG48]MCD7052749.1 SDR family oxidoreductase [Rhodococcus sp. BH2-1]GBF16963.1 3-oxoacyl-[acyl-carrier-protein] reductase FabG [Rhodococcus sp. Br-6]AVP66832.1 SDR family NAD(P)-dependent oxidoreductase [Prescottella equi]ERN47470.1 putative 3-oxoacyl-[acyl-carrier-protein] reductase [Prescottella equi NBRC 101255 = C 7]